MRDGLRVLDQFGQKAPGGGNYKLEITGEAGVNEVQKSDVFKVKHEGSTAEVAETNPGSYGGNAQWELDLSDIDTTNASGTFTLSFDVGTSTYTTVAINITAVGTNGSGIATALGAITAFTTQH